MSFPLDSSQSAESSEESYVKVEIVNSQDTPRRMHKTDRIEELLSESSGAIAFTITPSKNASIPRVIRQKKHEHDAFKE